MARIVYGVSGEGSGHSSRAREMVRHLIDQGHQVRLVSYDRGYRNLKNDFDVFETEGLSISSDDNRVSVVKTFTDNVRRLPEGHRKLQLLRKTLFKEFQPDCVITDFEPMTAYLANHYDLPLITVDNQHRMRYVRYESPPGMDLERQITKTIIRAIVPKPDVSLATAFCFGDVMNSRTFLFPPILRSEVLALQPRVGDHILVYTTGAFASLLDVVKQFPRERFHVYGCENPVPDGPLIFQPFSKQGFLDDLAGTKAVIATAGFTLISEALALQKPYLALPMQGQFEQQLNAFQLQMLGYGRTCKEPTPEAVGDFLYRLPDYRQRLADYRPGDNGEIKQMLDHLLADDCARAREFHALRAT
jgi:uncharacterized protein (TIGR00661 family)